MSFQILEQYGHEQVVFCHNPEVGLKAIIAIHNTHLGPALGGTRMWPYKNEQEALVDVLRLSKGMTYKAAAAGLNLGGGKAVIIGDPKKDKTEGLFRAFGRFVESLSGRYITAEDVGTDVNDMEYINMESRHVTGVDVTHGGSGDPSPVTARGVYEGMRAALSFSRGSDSLKGVKVAVQGLGHVGHHLCKLLHDDGAMLIASDIDRERCDRVRDEFKAEIVEPNAIHAVACDVFAPCALGAIINDKTIPELKCKIIAGAANNQLAEDRHGLELYKKGFFYAPDYVINAGGLMNVYVELEGYSRERAMRLCKTIYYNVGNILKISKEENVPTNAAADRLVHHRMTTVTSLKSTYLRRNPNDVRRLSRH